MALSSSDRAGLAVAPPRPLRGEFRYRRLDAVQHRPRPRPLRRVVGTQERQAPVIRCAAARQPARRTSRHCTRRRCESSQGPRRRKILRPLLPDPQLHVRLTQRGLEFLVLGFEFEFPRRPAPLEAPRGPHARLPRTRSSSRTPSARPHRRAGRPPPPTPHRAAQTTPPALSLRARLGRFRHQHLLASDPTDTNRPTTHEFAKPQISLLRTHGNPRNPLGRIGHQPLRVSHQTTPVQVFLTRDTQPPLSHSSTKGELPLKSRSPWSTREAPTPMPRRSRVSAPFTVGQKTDLTPHPRALRGSIRRTGSSKQVSPTGNVVSVSPTLSQCAQRT